MGGKHLPWRLCALCALFFVGELVIVRAFRWTFKDGLGKGFDLGIGKINFLAGVERGAYDVHRGKFWRVVMGGVAVWMIAVFDFDFDFPGNVGGVLGFHSLMIVNDSAGIEPADWFG